MRNHQKNYFGLINFIKLIYCFPDFKYLNFQLPWGDMMEAMIGNFSMIMEAVADPIFHPSPRYLILLNLPWVRQREIEICCTHRICRKTYANRTPPSSIK